MPLRGRADKCLAELGPDEQKHKRGACWCLGAQWIDLSSGVRLRVSLAADRRVPSSRPQRLIACWARWSRLACSWSIARVRGPARGSAAGHRRIAHEALLRKWPLLAQWVTEDAKLLAELRPSRAGCSSFSACGTLLRGAQPEQAQGILAATRALGAAAETLLHDGETEAARAADRDAFAHDCLRLLAVQGPRRRSQPPSRDPARTESRTPTAVPMWLPYAVDLLQAPSCCTPS